VDVYGADQQLRFLAVVGAHGPRGVQAARLGAALRGRIGNPNVDTLPQQMFEHVKAAMAERGLSAVQIAKARGVAYNTAQFSFAPSRRTILSYADVLDSAHLRSLATSDLFWDRIIAIEPAGNADV